MAESSYAPSAFETTVTKTPRLQPLASSVGSVPLAAITMLPPFAAASSGLHPSDRTTAVLPANLGVSGLHPLPASTSGGSTAVSEGHWQASYLPSSRERFIERHADGVDRRCPLLQHGVEPADTGHSLSRKVHARQRVDRGIHSVGARCEPLAKRPCRGRRLGIRVAVSEEKIAGGADGRSADGIGVQKGVERTVGVGHVLGEEIRWLQCKHDHRRSGDSGPIWSV